MTTQNEHAPRLEPQLGRARGFAPVRRLAVGVIALALLGPSLWVYRAAAADEAPAAAAAPTPAAAASAAGLSEQESERQAEAISRSIMSPFCPGRTVSSCPNAQPWRDDIRKWVREGVEPDEIKRRLAERVPKHDLMGVPQNRLGWVLPVGLGIGALGTLVFLLRYLVAARGSGNPTDPKRGKAELNGAPEPSSTGKPVPDDWDDRLDQELETIEQR
jgi:cytochrome c-type biogenesis protein CcmH/NrfF